MITTSIVVTYEVETIIEMFRRGSFYIEMTP